MCEMSTDKIRAMILAIIEADDHDAAKHYNPAISEDPEGAERQMMRLVGIAREHMPGRAGIGVDGDFQIHRIDVDVQGDDDLWSEVMDITIDALASGDAFGMKVIISDADGGPCHTIDLGELSDQEKAAFRQLLDGESVPNPPLSDDHDFEISMPKAPNEPIRAIKVLREHIGCGLKLAHMVISHGHGVVVRADIAGDLARKLTNFGDVVVTPAPQIRRAVFGLPVKTEGGE